MKKRKKPFKKGEVLSFQSPNRAKPYIVSFQGYEKIKGFCRVDIFEEWEWNQLVSKDGLSRL